eukprot:CAMPEP_0194356810 /NCGR_PEP_ID=MMETSP0174-20130528/4382_1 /TAXON_ID=216777 /ORGANISM="Proboscia alata, Strain PI-D3" /LENGTH=660 /DNA_ID=CAMNT_0039126559 /DNA_START=1270 /DNA_END=3252 /DNA_ORIENTATION=+
MCKCGAYISAHELIPAHNMEEGKRFGIVSTRYMESVLHKKMKPDMDLPGYAKQSSSLASSIALPKTAKPLSANKVRRITTQRRRGEITTIKRTHIPLRSRDEVLQFSQQRSTKKNHRPGLVSTLDTHTYIDHMKSMQNVSNAMEQAQIGKCIQIESNKVTTRKGSDNLRLLTYQGKFSSFSPSSNEMDLFLEELWPQLQKDKDSIHDWPPWICTDQYSKGNKNESKFTVSCPLPNCRWTCSEKRALKGHVKTRHSEFEMRRYLNFRNVYKRENEKRFFVCVEEAGEENNVKIVSPRTSCTENEYTPKDMGIRKRIEFVGKFVLVPPFESPIPNLLICPHAKHIPPHPRCSTCNKIVADGPIPPMKFYSQAIVFDRRQSRTRELQINDGDNEYANENITSQESVVLDEYVLRTKIITRSPLDTAMEGDTENSFFSQRGNDWWNSFYVEDRKSYKMASVITQGSPRKCLRHASIVALCCDGQGIPMAAVNYFYTLEEILEMGCEIGHYASILSEKRKYEEIIESPDQKGVVATLSRINSMCSKVDRESQEDLYDSSKNIVHKSKATLTRFYIENELVRDASISWVQLDQVGAECFIFRASHWLQLGLIDTRVHTDNELLETIHTIFKTKKREWVKELPPRYMRGEIKFSRYVLEKGEIVLEK